jgi:preprotein translocase subunit SecA
MIDKFLTKVFGSSNQRYIKTLLPLIQQINDLEPSAQKLSDDQMRERIIELREQVKEEVGARSASAARRWRSTASCPRSSP